MNFYLWGVLTLDDFNALTTTEKAEKVWSGSFLADREADGVMVQLYSLGSFYVEVYYDPARNQITDFLAFTSRNLLVPYLAQLKFTL